MDDPNTGAPQPEPSPPPPPYSAPEYGDEAPTEIEAMFLSKTGD